jgi:sodium-independent sulfate anion transporter 11
MSALAGQLPVATIILLLEHIAISKCEHKLPIGTLKKIQLTPLIAFGRVNGYKIDPNQELIAIGVTNTRKSFTSITANFS